MSEEAIGRAMPPAPAQMLAALHAAGYSAYAVGGCVRDCLLGRTPQDWDLCTAARPEEIRRVFSGHRMLLNGLKHGTVTVFAADGTHCEITTYRVEDSYADHRHPDAVRFVPQVEQDLARRDFTINAMAWSPQSGLIDVFGGRADLAAGIVRCVGDPQQRFAEDALRILRAVRFAAQLEFALEPQTAQAALALRDTVSGVSAERCFAELDRLLTGPAAATVLARHGAVLGGVLPELLPCIGCEQAVWHRYDVWQHTAATVGALDLTDCTEADARILRWAALLHDLAKPECRILEADGMPHFPGHNQRGGVMAAAILRRLRAPQALIQGVSALVSVHDVPLPTEDPDILRLLNRYGPLFLQRLCRLKCADLDAHAVLPNVTARRQATCIFEARMRKLSAEGCYTVRQLAVSGADVLQCGIRPGAAVGQTLAFLLEQVMDGTLPNERQALLKALQA